MSLPLLFTPVKYKYGHLLDGGILNPVPIAPTFNDSTDFTVAVNLGGPKVADAPAPAVRKEPAEESSALRETLDKFIDTLASTFADKQAEPSTAAFYDVANEAFDAMQGARVVHCFNTHFSEHGTFRIELPHQVALHE